MTDRELLESAAKAAGYTITGFDLQENPWCKAHMGSSLWNPLTNDGDALLPQWERRYENI